MLALREFPPNPHVVVYHLVDRLTDQIVETYFPGYPAPREWVEGALALPGIRVLSLNAYKIRLQKEKSVGWSDLLASFEKLLGDRLSIRRIEDLVESESRHRHFCWHGAPFERKVFEGALQAQVHPLASELFSLPGVAEVILDGNQVRVRKCPLLPWSELAPSVQEVLSNP